MSATTRHPAEPDNQSSSWSSPATKGAPFAVLMLLGLIANVVIASQASPEVVFVMMLLFAVYLLAVGFWNRRLTATRWAHARGRGTAPEKAALWTTIALMAVGVAATFQGSTVIPWVAFAVQAVVAAVIIPITLRRYPGFA